MIAFKVNFTETGGIIRFIQGHTIFWLYTLYLTTKTFFSIHMIYLLIGWNETIFLSLEFWKNLDSIFRFR